MCLPVTQQASGSIGRAAVSKTAGWGFETLLACHSQSGLASHKAQAFIKPRLQA